MTPSRATLTCPFETGLALNNRQTNAKAISDSLVRKGLAVNAEGFINYQLYMLNRNRG